MIFNNKGNLINLQMQVDACSKKEILDSTKFKFKPNTILLGDTNYDSSMVNLVELTLPKWCAQGINHVNHGYEVV